MKEEEEKIKEIIAGVPLARLVMVLLVGAFESMAGAKMAFCMVPFRRHQCSPQAR